MENEEVTGFAIEQIQGVIPSYVFGLLFLGFLVYFGIQLLRKQKAKADKAVAKAGDVHQSTLSGMVETMGKRLEAQQKEIDELRRELHNLEKKFIQKDAENHELRIANVKLKKELEKKNGG